MHGSVRFAGSPTPQSNYRYGDDPVLLPVEPSTVNSSKQGMVMSPAWLACKNIHDLTPRRSTPHLPAPPAPLDLLQPLSGMPLDPSPSRSRMALFSWRPAPAGSGSHTLGPLRLNSWSQWDFRTLLLYLAAPSCGLLPPPGLIQAALPLLTPGPTLAWHAGHFRVFGHPLMA